MSVAATAVGAITSTVATAATTAVLALSRVDFIRVLVLESLRDK
jgi:hypothetical protein